MADTRSDIFRCRSRFRRRRVCLSSLNVVTSRRRFAEDGTELFISECRKCSTIIFPHSLDQSNPSFMTLQFPLLMLKFPLYFFFMLLLLFRTTKNLTKVRAARAK